MLSRTQQKKVDEKEQKKNSVQQLLLKVTVDKDLSSETWAEQYEQRKAEAIKGMEEGNSAAKVGSLSAFHSGLYADNTTTSNPSSGSSSTSVLVPAGSAVPEQRAIPVQEKKEEPVPITNTQARPFVGQTSSGIAVPPSNYIKPLMEQTPTTNNPFTAPIAPAFTAPSTTPRPLNNPPNPPPSSSGCGPPPSPLDLLRMAGQSGAGSGAVFKQFGKVEGEEEEETKEEQNPPASLPVGDPSKMTMTQLFKAVKCDSKRSSEDWQTAYQERKRARIEEEVKRHENRTLTNDLSEVKQSLSEATTSTTPTTAPPPQARQPPQARPPGPPAASPSPQEYMNMSNSQRTLPGNSPNGNMNRGGFGNNSANGNGNMNRGGFGNTNSGFGGNNRGSGFNSNRGFDNNRGGGFSSNRGFDNRGGGFGNNSNSRGGFGNSRGGNRGGFNSNRGGNGGGFSGGQRGGFSNNRGGFGNNTRGHQDPSSRFPHNQINSRGRGNNFGGNGGFQSNRGRGGF